MKAKYFSLIVFVIGILCFGLRLGQDPAPDPESSRRTFLSQAIFRSPMRSGRRYEGIVKGNLGLDDRAQAISISGNLGFGRSDQQTLLHYKGGFGAYELNLDWLKEADKNFVRSYSLLTSGATPQSFLKQFLGSLSDTDGQFVYLQGLISRDRLHYMIHPGRLFQMLSGAIYMDSLLCKNKNACQIIIDTDLLSLEQQKKGSSSDPVLGFFQELIKQDVWYDPIQSLVTINLLQSRRSSISGKIGKDKLELLRDGRGLVREVISIKHEVENVRHTIWLDFEKDGDLEQSRKIVYDMYPDGRDMTVNSLLTGVVFDLKGNRYDAGAFVPIDKGNPVDIYGLLAGKNY